MSEVSQEHFGFVPLKQIPFFRDCKVEAHDVIVVFLEVILYVCKGKKLFLQFFFYFLLVFLPFVHTAIYVY